MKKLLTWISNLNRIFWERAVRSTYVDAKSLSVFRIIAGLFLLLAYMPSFSWIGDMPKTLFNPPVLSLTNLFDSFPGKTFFFVLDSLVLLSLICLTLGIKARISAMVYLVVCLVGLNFQYSFGKISHPILAYVMMGCMAFSGWGRHLAMLPDKESKIDNTAKSISLFGILICFGMFTAGFEKALVWVDFDLTLNGFLNWSHNGIFHYYKDYLFAPYIKYLPTALLELFDYTAVLFELSPLLFLLYSKRGWKVWLLTACAFHLINIFLLNIPYPFHFIVYLAFVDFTSLYHKLQYYLSLAYIRRIATGIVVLLILIRCMELVFGRSLASIFLKQGETMSLMYSGIVVWGIAIALVVNDILQEQRKKKYQKFITQIDTPKGPF